MKKSKIEQENPSPQEKWEVGSQPRKKLLNLIAWFLQKDAQSCTAFSFYNQSFFISDNKIYAQKSDPQTGEKKYKEIESQKLIIEQLIKLCNQQTRNEFNSTFMGFVLANKVSTIFGGKILPGLKAEEKNKFCQAIVNYSKKPEIKIKRIDEKIKDFYKISEVKINKINLGVIFFMIDKIERRIIKFLNLLNNDSNKDIKDFFNKLSLKKENTEFTEVIWEDNNQKLYFSRNSEKKPELQTERFYILATDQKKYMLK